MDAELIIYTIILFAVVAGVYFGARLFVALVWAWWQQRGGEWHAE